MWKLGDNFSIDERYATCKGAWEIPFPVIEQGYIQEQTGKCPAQSYPLNKISLWVSAEIASFTRIKYVKQGEWKFDF